MNRPIRFAVLTVSDRCSRAEAEDASGPALVALATERLSAELVETACVADETNQIAGILRTWSRPDRTIDLVLATGGTGLGPRDVTPEAALKVIERPHAGLMELARHRSAATSPRAYLSRAVAGVTGRTLIITLPGSPGGATETFSALLDVLPHAIEMLRGGAH